MGKASGAKKVKAVKAAGLKKVDTAKHNLVEALDVEESLADTGEEKQAASGEKKLLNKCLTDNFPGWGDVLIYMTFVDGLNLSDTLERDRTRAKEDADFKMGKFYYQHKREQFGGTAPEQIIPVVNEDEPGCDVLNRVLKLAFNHNRKLEPLSEYVKAAPSMNQKNLAALLRGALRLSPTASADTATVLVDILNMCIRLRVPANHPGTFNPVKGHFDAALSKTLNAYKKNKKTGLAWWDKYRSSASIFLPADAVDRVYACKSGFASISADIAEVHGSCKTGNLLMAKAFEQTKSIALQECLENSMAALIASDITSESVGKCKADFINDIAELGKDAFATIVPARKHKVALRSYEIVVPCTSWISIWNLSKDAVIQTVGLELGLLDPLWCDSEILGTSSIGKGVKVADSLLAESKNARASCRDFLPNTSASGETIRATLKRKKAFLFQEDPGFKVIYEFWQSLVGDRAEDAMKAKVLSCLPTSKSSDAKIADTLQGLTSLCQSSFAKFVGTAPSAIATTVKGYLNSMNTGKCPRFAMGDESAFMKEVKASLAQLCVCEDPHDASEKLYGKDALNVKFQVVKSQTTPRTVACLRDLNAFAWLLAPPDRAQLRTWDDNVMTPVEAASVCPDSAAAGSSMDPKKAPKKRAGTDVNDLVAKMFKK